MKRFDEKTQLRLAWLLLGLLMLLYTVDISYQAVLRYDTFKATAFDLGNMDQVFWNTLHGRFFQFTNQSIDWYGPPTRLAIHFEPIIIPLSLLYLIRSDPRTLLIFQTLVLVTGALPVFLLTRKYIPRWPLLAAMMAGAYLSMPALMGLNMFDFHPVSLATPLLLFAFLALANRRYGWCVVACIVASACKEDIPFAVAMFGLLAIWRYKAPRLGSALFVMGLVWGLLAFLVIIPHFYPGAQHNNFWYRYEVLGSTPALAIVNLLVHPWLIFTTFITIDRVYYLAGLFRNSGFLALLAPEWLVPALPSLAVNLLSIDPLLYSGVYHYNAAVIPCVMLAAIHGTQRAIVIWQRWRGEVADLIPVVEQQSPIAENRWQGTIHILRPQAILRSNPSSVLALAHSSMQTMLTSPRFAHVTTSLRMRWSSIERFSERQWQLFSARIEPLAKAVPLTRLQYFVYSWMIVLSILNYILMIPQLNAFWADHLPGSREQQMQQLLDMIPPTASVSASANLNPHLSERLYVTVFPALTIANPTTHDLMTVQYVIVDLYALFPEDRVSTTKVLNQLIQSGQFSIVARANGVELLKRHGP